MTNRMNSMEIQVLRTIDKFDRIGRDGVVELLQKPEGEFGAGLDPVRAELVGQLFDTKGQTNRETLENLTRYIKHAGRVGLRLRIMTYLETQEIKDGYTMWDRLIDMPTSPDETWQNGMRPENLGWALDDIAALIATLVRRDDAPDKAGGPE